MRRVGITLFVVAALMTVAIYFLRQVRFDLLIARAMIGALPSAEAMYPPSPSDLPACVSTPLPELLVKYEKLLVELGVDVQSDLQRGLTDGELDAIEVQYQFKLTEDIRQLYKWHNGTPETCGTEVFPWGRFLPIDDSLKIKNLPNTHPDPEVQKLHAQMLAFRQSWIPVIEDASGNGFYFDPDRSTQSSSFFYHAHDDIPYYFYPCVGNYIQSLIDMHAQGQLIYNNQSIQVTEPDIVKFVNQYGKFVAE